MLPKNKDEELAQLMTARLSQAFERAGWRVLPGPPNRQVDLICESGGQAYAVQVNALAGAGRTGHLRGLLADVVLRSRAAAEELGVLPLAVVAASVLSDAMVQQLRSYREAFAPNVAWGVMDLRGRSELVGAGLAEVQAAFERADGGPARRGARIGGGAPSVRSAPRPNPFSDLGQWMIKVLLAERVAPEFLAAPREHVRGVRHLAQVAGVSAFSASSCVRGLRELGCLEVGRGGLRIVRLYHLLDRWRSAVRRVSEQRLARFALPVGDVAVELRARLAVHRGRSGGPSPAGRRSCLALFSAASALGLGWVRGAPSHLYSEDLSDAGLEELGLVAAGEPHAADVVLLRPRFPEAVFRGCVERDGVPVADALQCWLDLADHPVRGAEQAAEILDRLGLGGDEARD